MRLALQSHSSAQLFGLLPTCADDRFASSVKDTDSGSIMIQLRCEGQTQIFRICPEKPEASLIKKTCPLCFKCAIEFFKFRPEKNNLV